MIARRLRRLGRFFTKRKEDKRIIENVKCRMYNDKRQITQIF